MPELKIPPRSEIPKQYTWNAESVFATVEEWQTEMASIAADLEALAPYRQSMMDGPDQLVATFRAIESLMRRIEKAYMYAMFSYAVDTTNQASAEMNSQAQGLYSRVVAAATRKMCVDEKHATILQLNEVAFAVAWITSAGCQPQRLPGTASRQIADAEGQN